MFRYRPPVMRSAKAEVVPLLVARKNRLAQDLGALYRNLAEWSEASVDFDEGWDARKISLALASRLIRQASALRDRGLPELAEQAPLRVPLSLEGLRSIRRLSKILLLSAKDREIEYDRIESELEKLARIAPVPEERLALKAAMANLKKFRAVYRAWVENKVPHAEFQEVWLDLPKFFGERWPEMDQLLVTAKSGKKFAGHGSPSDGEW